MTSKRIAARSAGLAADLKHAARVYRKTPWQTGLAVLMLAAAMALVSAMATLWADLHLSGLPGLESNRGLVTIGMRSEFSMGVMGADAFEALRESTNTLESVSGVSTISFLRDTSLNGQPIEGHAEPVLPGYFQTLRPRMHLGRGLEDDDFADDGQRHLVLSYRLWQTAFDSDPEILLTEVELKGERWRVVGVVDEAFTGTGGVPTLMWLPYGRFMRDIQSMPEMIIDDIPVFRLFGRKAPGIGTAAVEAEIDRFMDTHEFPSMFGMRQAGELLVADDIVSHPMQRLAAQRQVSILAVASILVALVAAANMGIFLLARAPARQRELALRQALGASRRRIVGQLLTEAGLLVAIAAAAGIVVSIWLAAGFRELAFLERAGLNAVNFNLTALAATVVVAALLTALVALVPAALLKRGRIGEQSRQASSRPGPFQHGAALVQLGLAGLVGACALSFLLHLHLLDQRDPGFRTDGVQAALLAIRDATPGMRPSLPEADAVTAFRSDLRERLAALAGVDAVSFASPLPGQMAVVRVAWEIGDQSVNAKVIQASPGFIELMGIRLLHGRDFEGEMEPGLIVSRQFAEQAWGETDVVGRHVSGDDDQMRIIGVIDDLRYGHPDDPIENLILSTGMGMHNSMAAIVVSGNATQSEIESRVNESLDRHMDALSVMDVRSLTEIRGEALVRDRARAGITALYGSLIVLMAGFGFFAMQRFLVDSGQREIAVHQALGAGPRSVRRRVLGSGLRLGLPGVVLGALLGLVAVAWLRDDLISRAVNAPLVAGVTLVALFMLLVLATLQPARRASRLKAGDLLREE